MSGLVIRLAGVEQPETRIFHEESITIGTSPACHLSFRPEQHNEEEMPPDAELLELKATAGIYQVTRRDESTTITRDGERVGVGDVIRDGDTYYFGKTGVRLRFFFLTPTIELVETLQLGAALQAHAHSEAVRMGEAALSEGGEGGRNRATAAPRTDIALVFVKQLLRELVAEIPKRRLYTTLAIIAAVIGAIIYVNALSFLESRRNSRAMEDLRNQVAELHEGLNQARAEISMTRDETKNLAGTISFAASVVENYGRGVCLIYGVYVWTDPRTGREARFREPSETNSLISPGGSVNLSINGNGPVCEVDFIGTGFIASSGLILTNRHVAQPWYGDVIATVVRGQGLRPKVKELYAYFPKVPEPFKLTVLESSRSSDVAICGFEQGDIVLPVLPLDEKGEGAVSGQSVVLMGYPAGIEGLLAKTGEDDAILAMSRRDSLQDLLNELAVRAQIRPYSTQGHIGDLTPNRVVYDAQTSEGGSGGPVFGSNARVIAINQAVLPGSPANFGVPIRFGLELLRKYQTDQAGDGKSAEAGRD